MRMMTWLEARSSQHVHLTLIYIRLAMMCQTRAQLGTNQRFQLVRNVLVLKVYYPWLCHLNV